MIYIQNLLYFSSSSLDFAMKSPTLPTLQTRGSSQCNATMERFDVGLHCLLRSEYNVFMVNTVNVVLTFVHWNVDNITTDKVLFSSEKC